MATVDKRKRIGVQSLENQLDPNEAQDHAEAVAQVHEFAEQRVDQEEELAQPHQRKHVAREHEESL